MTPVVVASVASQNIGDDVLIFDGALLQRLTRSAAAVWHHIDGLRTSEKITTDLQADYHHPVGLQQDVPAFLAELERAGLITLEPTVLGRLSVPSTVAWDHDGERVVMADLMTGKRAALSETATLVWLLAGEGLTTDEVVAEVAGAFPGAPASLASDVVATLDQLVAEGWLRAG